MILDGATIKRRSSIDFIFIRKCLISFDYFKLAFQHMLHLLASDFFGMISQHIWDCFHP